MWAQGSSDFCCCLIEIVARSYTMIVDPKLFQNHIRAERSWLRCFVVSQQTDHRIVELQFIT